MNENREREAGNGPGETKVSRILIVDDYPVTRRGIASLVAAAPDLAVCGEAASEAEALALLEPSRPNLVIVDIVLHKSNGLDLIRSIRRRDRHLPMLVLSMQDEALYAERVLRAGAQGYVMKEVPPEELLRAIRVTLGHGLYMSPEVARQLTSTGGRGGARATRPTGVARLSDKELMVFHMVGRGNPTRAIATELHLSMKTVQTHYAHIKRKLGFSHLAELVQKAVQWVSGEGGRRTRTRTRRRT